MTQSQARISDIPAGELEVGQKFGPYRYPIDAADTELWNANFEHPGTVQSHEVAPGFMSLIFLKCAMDAFGGIPRGAVLTRQQYDFHKRPKSAAPVDTELEILKKEERKGRPWITFEVRVTQDGVPAVDSRLTWIWARK